PAFTPAGGRSATDTSLLRSPPVTPHTSTADERRAALRRPPAGMRVCAGQRPSAGQRERSGKAHGADLTRGRQVRNVYPRRPVQGGTDTDPVAGPRTGDGPVRAGTQVLGS